MRVKGEAAALMQQLAASIRFMKSVAIVHDLADQFAREDLHSATYVLTMLEDDELAVFLIDPDQEIRQLAQNEYSKRNEKV